MLLIKKFDFKVKFDIIAMRNLIGRCKFNTKLNKFNGLNKFGIMYIF